MHRSGHRKLGLLIVAAVLAVSAGGALWFYRHSAPVGDDRKQPLPAAVDPRLAYQGKFRNIDPSVRYVGSAACDACHERIAATYHKHPMARSLMPIAEVDRRESYDEDHNNPFVNDQFKSRFRVDRDSHRVQHQQTRLDGAGGAIFERVMDVQYVIGSGTRGYSYLSQRDGYLFQSPISWYSQKDRWDLSPNFTHEMLGGRPVFADCLFCHANRAIPWEGTLNRYRAPIFVGHGIGCERCHGPGEKHVQSPGRFDPQTNMDYTIVNPRKLDHAEREAVCQQCHLASEGRVLRRGRGLYDFRPGLPLDSCWSIFVEADEAKNQNAVNHVEQMYLSHCSQQSSGAHKLGCISCHNPHEHVGPERRVSYYRDRCLQCHTEGASVAGKVGCAMPRARRRQENQADSCIACHMPRYAAADIPHNASTNHRIVRRPSKPRPAVPHSRGMLVHFHQGKVKDDDAEVSRDLGIALSRMTAARLLPPAAGDQARKLLAAAAIHFPDDIHAHEELGKVLYFRKRAKEALAAFDIVLAKDAKREISLAFAALIAQGQGRDGLALDYWRRAVDVNPWAMEYVGNYTMLLAHKGDWDRVQKQSLAWIRLDPENINARRLQIECLVRAGKLAEAHDEMAKIEALNPPDLPQVQAWFAGRTTPVKKGSR